MWCGISIIELKARRVVVIANKSGLRELQHTPTTISTTENPSLHQLSDFSVHTVYYMLFADTTTTVVCVPSVRTFVQKNVFRRKVLSRNVHTDNEFFRKEFLIARGSKIISVHA